MLKHSPHTALAVAGEWKHAYPREAAAYPAAWLKEQRIIRRPGPIKLLAGGELKVALTVQVDAASEAAKKAVEAAGGKLETPNLKG